jgi:hypothetical protein
MNYIIFNKLKTAIFLSTCLFVLMGTSAFTTEYSKDFKEYLERPEEFAPPGEIHYLPELRVMKEEKIEAAVKQFYIITEYQLPDLRTLPAHNLRLVVNNQAGTRELQFSNSIWNAGDGPLEFRGSENKQEENAEVFQVLYIDDEPADEIPMGNFYFNESHNHWHWEGFSLYEIWSIHEDGVLDELLVESGKVGYCIRDDSRVDRFNVAFDHPNRADRPGYRFCGTRVQGLSVGWVDTYAYNTSGQSLDITDLPDGIYALRSVADPDGEILEKDKDSNEAITFFQLERSRVRVIEEPDI